jgi:hypothetical protein
VNNRRNRSVVMSVAERVGLDLTAAIAGGMRMMTGTRRMKSLRHHLHLLRHPRHQKSTLSLFRKEVVAILVMKKKNQTITERKSLIVVNAKNNLIVVTVRRVLNDALKMNLDITPKRNLKVTLKRNLIAVRRKNPLKSPLWWM